MNQATREASLSIPLSLLATPWLLIVSTASALYLINQPDLYYRYELLYPFLGVALAIFGIAILFALLGKKFKAYTPLLWSYYLLAPLYMVFQSGAGQFSQAAALAVWGIALLLIYIGLIVFLSRKVTIAQAAPLFAMIGCAFIALDSYNFFIGYQPYQSAYSQADNNTRAAAGAEKEPNIYHIVLDEYQVDMFTLTLNDEVKEKFSGFTLFNDATAVFGRTEMSLPSIFSGRHYDFDSAPIDYQKAAFAGNGSLLAALKANGYQTSAVMFPVFDFELTDFDDVAFHKQVSQFDYSAVDATFRKLWAFRTIPTAIIGRFLDPVDLDQLKHKNLLSVSAPIESYESMVNLTADEKYLPGNNRYQFIHLLLPHFPYVLDKNCHYTKDRKTSPMAQARCANKLMTDFIDTLKSVGRYDDSLIVIQSDHGARFKLEGGKLQGLGGSDADRFGTDWSRARSRTLLMIKPAGAGDATLATSDAKISLLDVAPTIVKSLGLRSDLAFDGNNIFDPQFSDNDQQRYYYFYNKKGTRGRHIIKMTRFRIEDTELIDEGLVKSGVFN